MLCIVHIEEIRPTGLDLVRELPAAFVEAAVAKSLIAFQVESGAQFKAHLERRSDRVLLDGHLTLTVTGPCKRCLTPVTTPLAIDFQLNFVKEAPKSKNAKGDDEESHGEPDQRASFELADVDTELFDGQRLELDPLIEEQIVLALPMDLLCKADCKGLCTVCGQDRNLTTCDHEQKPSDPRWAVLKDLKLPN